MISLAVAPRRTEARETASDQLILQQIPFRNPIYFFLNVFFAALRLRLIGVKREVGCVVPTPQMNYIPLRLIDRLSGI